MEIQLSQGKVAIVDDDFAHLAEWRWCAAKMNGIYYATRKVTLGPKKQALVLMHHAILGRSLDGFVVDHRNGNGLDNRLSNLRFITRARNNTNNKRLRSGLPIGAYKRKDGRWRAIGKVRGKVKYFGTFDTKEEAAEAFERNCR